MYSSGNCLSRCLFRRADISDSLVKKCEADSTGVRVLVAIKAKVSTKINDFMILPVRIKRNNYKIDWNKELKVILGFCAEVIFVQLNKYETAPNCIQLSQNLTLDCLLI